MIIDLRSLKIDANWSQWDPGITMASAEIFWFEFLLWLIYAVLIVSLLLDVSVGRLENFTVKTRWGISMKRYVALIGVYSFLVTQVLFLSFLEKLF